MENEQIIKIMETLGRLDERTLSIQKAVEGNGQPGLKQRVEDLEGTKKYFWGLGSAVVGLTGFFEWLFHRGIGGR